MSIAAVMTHKPSPPLLPPPSTPISPIIDTPWVEECHSFYNPAYLLAVEPIRFNARRTSRIKCSRVADLSSLDTRHTPAEHHHHNSEVCA